MRKCVYFFTHKYLLSIFVPGSGNETVNKIDKNPCSCEAYVLVGGDRQRNKNNIHIMSVGVSVVEKKINQESGGGSLGAEGKACALLK